ncbi:alpha/beta hydrolase [Kineosporia sp. NBRC 101731]|uniref:alpha/beta hydrolase n=1 Tax=Kineosporia sp. NBRC 101731 TaxID=3032199 RepID=UPI0024A10F9A|nr:alpha/beta hydrolase [Kineosporia sp. NBRC 101731]GLY28106.1 alpha/beta hydrolase [Kineosporia sp. NBRC 101731]
MSADWAQVSLWRSAPLEEKAESLHTTENTLVQLGYDMFGSGLGVWTGAAALFAGIQRNLLKESLEDRITEVSAVRRALHDASDSVASVEHAVKVATEYAADNGLWIAGDGTVNDERGVTVMGDSSDQDVDSALADRQSTINECLMLVEEAVRRAYYVDQDLFAVLNDGVLSGSLAQRDAADFRQAERDGAGAGKLGPYKPPQDSATPAQNAAWWAALTQTEQDGIRRDHPEWIANRDGLSAKLRNEANETLLKRYTDQYTAEYNELDAYFKAKIAEHPDAERVIEETDDKSARYLWLREEVMPALKTLNKIASTSDETSPLLERQILGLKILPGERVQAIIAAGDVDSADNVSVFTPGFTTTTSKLDGYDQKMLELKRRAEFIAASSDDSDDQPTVATVTWLDYQAPQWSTVASSNSVLSAHTARSAGVDLADFYEGLNVSRADDPHLVALGHSYGSAVTGAALTKESGIDDAVVFGSPGLPIENVDQLKLHGTLYNEQAQGDRFVGESWATGFDPNYMADTVQLDTGASTGADKTPLAASHGHSEYLNNRTTSQNNLAAVIAGHPEQTVEKK